MRRRVTLVVGVAALSCTAPDAPRRPAIARLELRPHALVNLRVGDSIRFSVSAADADGEPIALSAGDVTASLTSPDAGVESDWLFVAGASPASTWLVVDANGVRDSTYVTTFAPADTAHITLQFADDVPDQWRMRLRWAADVWEGVIGGALPAALLDGNPGACRTFSPIEPPAPPQAGTETGVRIYVWQSDEYAPDTYVEATGGPCVNRGLPRPTTVIGQIILNRDKPVSAIPDFRLRYLALHEMGHALGLTAVVQGEPPAWFDQGTGEYTGAMALEGWRRLFGSRTSLYVDGGFHWDDPPLHDIMAASPSGPGLVPPISRVTVGALIDLGYRTALDHAVTFP